MKNLKSFSSFGPLNESIWDDFKIGYRVKFRPNSFKVITNYEIDISGLEGTVMHVAKDSIVIKLDKEIKDLKAWDNDLIYGPEEFENLKNTAIRKISKEEHENGITERREPSYKNITVGELIDRLQKMPKDKKALFYWEGSVADAHISGVRDYKDGEDSVTILGY